MAPDGAGIDGDEPSRRLAPPANIPDASGIGHPGEAIDKGTARSPNFAQEPQPAQAVAADTPGAQLTAAGQSIVVESFSTLPGQTGSALTVAISPQTAGPESAGGRAFTSAFTREEELFRTKWGWAAHEAVRRAAREEAQASE